MFNSLTESLEAIAIQPNRDYVNKCIAIFQRCIDQASDEAAILIELEKLAKLTADVTKIKVTFGYTKPELIAGRYLCSIRAPQLTSFNPLLPKMMEKVANLDYENFVPEQLLKGEVDLVKCQVSGFYCDLEFNIKWTPAMFDGMLEADELCAVYFHELGHAWTMMEFMGQTIITNSILAGAVGQIAQDTPPERVFEIGKAAILMSGGEMPDEITDLQDIVIAVQIGQERRIQRRLQCKYVGNRLVERLADQFATRYMVGASLVKAFGKMERKRNPLVASTGYDPKWVGLTSNLLSIVSFPYTTLRAGVVRFTVGLLKGYSLSIAAPLLQASLMDYMNTRFGMADTETPIERTRSIQREMIGFLRDPSLPDDIRKQVLADIAILDTELRNVHKYGDVFGKVFRFAYNVAVGRAHGVGQATVQESLANNRLYEASASLKG